MRSPSPPMSAAHFTSRTKRRRRDFNSPCASKSVVVDVTYFFAFLATFLTGFLATAFFAGAFFAAAFLQQQHFLAGAFATFFTATFFAGAFFATFLGMRRRSKTVGKVAKGDGGADLKGPRHYV